MQPLFFFMLAVLVVAATPAMSQERSFTACTSQQDIEQVIGSDGKFVPDTCRKVTVTTVKSQRSDLCVMQFESKETGILGAIRDATMQSEWWTLCKELERR